MYKCFLSTLILLILCFSGCKQRLNVFKIVNKDTAASYSEKVALLDRNYSFPNDNFLSKDYIYIADSVMRGHKDLMKYYFIKYSLNTKFFEDTAAMKESFEGFKFLGDINGNSLKDSVFVYGAGYYFTDTMLPRLKTDSHCCHPDDIFSIGDIDEDGISEIGQYYSSCTSRYKSLCVYTLKNKQWQQVGQSVFDQHYMKYDVPFASYVRKAGKGKFEMHEISDLSADTSGQKKGLDSWLKFSF